MKTIDLTTPVLESFLAMQRVALSGAEALAALNAEAVKTLSRQAAATQPMPNAGAVWPWLTHEALKVPENLAASLTLSRRAYAICAITTTDWLGVCAERAGQMSEQSLDAIDTLGRMIPNTTGSAGKETLDIRGRLETAHRSYRDMLTAFRDASAAMAELPPSSAAKRGRA